MKKVEYIVDSFKDFTGAERQFVMAAVSLHGEPEVYIEEDGEPIDNDMKVLSIGVSVCRPDDEFNETLGKTIAEGKAIKYRNHALYAVDAGLINETMVKALLQQEAEYLKQTQVAIWLDTIRMLKSTIEARELRDILKPLKEKPKLHSITLQKQLMRRWRSWLKQ